jgi:multidrug resistance efflux pump
MDVPISPTLRRRRQARRWLAIVSAGVALAAATVGLARLHPAAPRVEKASLYFGTVQRGEMVRQVRGNGSLVPEQIQFVQAETDGRIERILVQPGALVTADTILMELSNPELEQSAFDAQWQLKAAEAQLTRLGAQLENERLSLKSTISALKAESTLAELDARVNDILAKEKLVSALEQQRARTKADELRERYQIEEERLQTSARSTDAQLAVQQAEVERARALLTRKRQQVAALRVRATVNGVLQQVGDLEPLQVGQRVTPSATLAKIVQPTHLKAVLKIVETQIRDVQVGQKAEIDTRNGIVSGRVSRLDPAAQNGTVTVDVSLEGPLPRGARPDLNVEGVIELERLESVLYVGRPVQAQTDSTVGLFKVVDGGKAVCRQPVKLGRSSVNAVEVVAGLQAGDQVVLSDMSQWDAHERLRLQ